MTTSPIAGEAHTHTPSRRRYFAVFGWLVFLTAIEVVATYLPIAKMTLVVFLLASSLAKAALVGLFFMHLLDENRLVLFVALSPFLLAGLFVLGLFPDIVYGYWR